MSFRTRMASWFIPSNWVVWLKTKKRLIGGVSLLLWVLIYGIPVIRPEWGTADLGLKLQSFLNSLGVPLDETLLGAGTGLTLIGWVDWILNYAPTAATNNVLKKVEKPFKS